MGMQRRGGFERHAEGQRPKYDRTKIFLYLASLFQKRFGAHETNGMYDMIKEAVEIHDLRVNSESLTRTSLRQRRAAATLTQAEGVEISAARGLSADKYRAATYDLRDRAIDRINEITRDPSFKGVPGAIQIKRLTEIRDSLSGDPFVGLDANVSEPR